MGGNQGDGRRRTTSVGRIVLASLVGATIEFHDFYIYGAAAALVIGQAFFPKSGPEAQALNAFLTFGIAAATFVDKILEGAKPGDIPIEQATRFKTIVNLKTGSADGLERLAGR